MDALQTRSLKELSTLFPGVMAMVLPAGLCYHDDRHLPLCVEKEIPGTM